MCKEELIKVIKDIEKEQCYNNIYCNNCLKKRFKQREIDELIYNKKLTKNTIRKLCEKEYFEYDDIIYSKTGDVVAPIHESFKLGY